MTDWSVAAGDFRCADVSELFSADRGRYNDAGEQPWRTLGLICIPRKSTPIGELTQYILTNIWFILSSIMVCLMTYSEERNFIAVGQLCQACLTSQDGSLLRLLSLERIIGNVCKLHYYQKHRGTCCILNKSSNQKYLMDLKPMIRNTFWV